MSQPKSTPFARMWEINGDFMLLKVAIDSKTPSADDNFKRKVIAELCLGESRSFIEMALTGLDIDTAHSLIFDEAFAETMHRHLREMSQHFGEGAFDL